MKKRIRKYILWISLFLFGIGIYAMHAGYFLSGPFLPVPQNPTLPQDTLTRYPVSRTTPEEYKDDLVKQLPADLRDPENLKTTIEYDIRTGTYVVRTRVGEMQLSTPMVLTPEEYKDYSMKQSLRSYFRKKNEEEFQKEMDKQFNLTDMQFDLGPAERLFGPGGVRVRTQGSAEIKIGLKNTTTKDPSLPARARSRTFFNFDETVQLNVQASVGTKVKFDMNYNTETSFDFDSKKLKLAYTGEEDEIIKTLEAGNVSMTTNNSLIRGGAALFGIKADLQFGKLRVNTLFAQQESQSKTVNSKGGVQTNPYEITVDQYDENRHFFLSHYFYENYDRSMAHLPTITSGITITRVEVWVTNKRNNFDQSRNIVAFSDLGEPKVIYNEDFANPLGKTLPDNRANGMYAKLLSEEFKGARNPSTVKSTLEPRLTGDKEYVKVTNARRLEDKEYTLQSELGYISLRTKLPPEEVLAVAYEYKDASGTIYQVGEFSNDNVSGATSGEEETKKISTNLFVKTLKATVLSPGMPYWNLMMKNIYSLEAYSVQKEKFQMNILYQSDTTGVYLNYLSEGAIKDSLLLRVMNLDRLDSRNERRPDGFFDFLPGYTIEPETGKIIFPVVQPFGSHLRAKIGNDAIADKYVYQELYDSTLTVARQIAEKNKFLLRGEYKASSGAEIQLGATNVARGSVVVTAGGATLTENVDYTVDYMSGVVTILNESIIASNTPVSVSLENQSMYSMQRKTMMGLDLNYQFTKDFSLGATVMHMSEMPLTTKTTMGDESLKNTLWGLNTSYKGESQWLTNMLDKLPLLTLTKPSHIAFNAEFAHLIAGHYENKNTGGYSYLDDFESTQSGISLQNPYSWQLASTPRHDGDNPRFPEAAYINDIRYGMNRSLLSWYYIDGIFNRKNSSARFPGIDKEQISNHYVRSVEVRELYPNKELGTNDISTLPVLNVAYYPSERGPYNLDADRINSDGTLQQPEKRWGGMMRRIEQSDFETANVEYIEFWMMDPFIYKDEAATLVKGGDLYFNLGEVSEDILKDEKKFFENGLPVNDDLSNIEETEWGRVPILPSTVYAFDNTENAREKQDVGLDGLSSEMEKGYKNYKAYVDKLRNILRPEVLAEMENDPLSPINDPAGDDYMYFRSDHYDAREAGVLERYKRYNGTDGNSRESKGRYDSSAKTLPDVEDINQDNTLTEDERYYEYRVSLRPGDTIVGTNHIVDVREAYPLLANGTSSERVRWFLFRIPVRNYERSVGSMSDFKSIRFVRMYMTGFEEPVVLRFGSLELVRGDWRVYTQDLSNPSVPPTSSASLVVSSVNIEENGDRVPINYVLPPGVTRMTDPSQSQIRQENEQSLSMKVTGLAPKDARAVYKVTNYDLRQYKRMQLFTHAEKLNDDITNVPGNRDLSVFIRLGSDYKNNYYEYEVPLTITQPGKYTNSSSGQLAVWPKENLLDFSLEALTDLKLERNRLKREGQPGVDYHMVYSKPDDSNNLNTMSIVGNPTLSEVKTIMIGVRNNTTTIKSGEIWVNELRLTDFNESGGWAANANLTVALSDLGTVNASGRIETAGFGALDQSLMERRLDDLKQYSVSTNLQLGKFFPEKANVSIPLYYAYSKETIDPEYNPLDQDIKLKDALDALPTKAEKDSVRSFSQEKNVTKSIAFNNVRVDIRSKTPMPYDPANFSFGYSYSKNDKRNPETEYETTKDYRGNFTYNYTPYVRPFRPFAKVGKDNGYTKYIKQLSLNYVPTSISFQTAMMRNYFEMQLRELTNTPGSKLPVSFSQSFTWDRAFSLRWNITNNLNFNFSSGTNARIEELNVQVNKKLNPDEYSKWKQSVWESIRDLGTPLRYDQTFQATWTLPLQFIPVLDWTNVTTSYTATYNWDRGAETGDPTLEIGNVIRNQRRIMVQGIFNLQNLYNKNPYLKKINQKFNQQTAAPRNAAVKQEPKKKPKFEADLTLNTDSGTIVEHKLLNKKVRITARRASNGKSYPLRYKILNYSQAVILNQDTVALKVTVVPGEKRSIEALNHVAEYSSRFLMMFRTINIQYGKDDGMMLPGFRPEVGDILGQKRTGILAPGLGFAFGDVRRSYIEEADERGWLVKNEYTLNPAIITGATNLLIQTSLEPIAGLKIRLDATRTETHNNKIEYMFEGMPETKGGNFNITTISIKTAFASTGDINNNYASKPFDEFIKNISIVRDRLESSYRGTNYPKAGFIAAETGYGGENYNPALDGGVNANSADVLIPAFLAAYTGKSAKKIGTSPFPSISSMLPNWQITYDGLIRIPVIRRHFKSFTLRHNYRSTYAVGSYSSFQNWVDTGTDGLGYIRNALSGNPNPSSQYDISSVNINEAFNPLLGADATLLNNITGRLMFNKTRNLSLNISSLQIVETFSNEWTLGVGYTLTEFNKVLKRKASQNFSNDLTLRFDFSYRKMQSLLRKIDLLQTTPTSGTIAKTLQFSADYALSRALTLRAFYDLQINEPLISTSFPTSNSNYGISFRFSLTQ